ncbi:MAG: hypothetical protein OEY72_00540 [Gammaproteobacteria bacterium]|nr:hypothetical protein [Gammaproteobacteria bacterium]
MAKRMFAVLLISLAAGFPVDQSRAQQIPVSVDGCAKLARVVYAEVSAAAIYGPGDSGPWVIDQGPGDIAVCAHVAKTVSQAFTSAMISAGVEVVWQRDHYDGTADRGDFCLSGFLSQCYPNPSPPLSNSIHSANDTLIRSSWAVVSQAVMREMYNPFSSDEVRFRDNDLKLRIGLSLRSIDDRRRQEPRRNGH